LKKLGLMIGIMNKSHLQLLKIKTLLKIGNWKITSNK
jgi:hypothetical protein